MMEVLYQVRYRLILGGTEIIAQNSGNNATNQICDGSGELSVFSAVSPSNSGRS